MDILLHKSWSTCAGFILILLWGRGNGDKEGGRATSTSQVTLTDLGCPRPPASPGGVHHRLPSWGASVLASPRGWGSWLSLDVKLPLFLLLNQVSPLGQERRGRGTLAVASSAPWAVAGVGVGRAPGRAGTRVRRCGFNHTIRLPCLFGNEWMNGKIEPKKQGFPWETKPRAGSS